jgi:hypothetical protein
VFHVKHLRSSRGGTRTPDPVINSHRVQLSVSSMPASHNRLANRPLFGNGAKRAQKRQGSPRTSPPTQEPM